MEVQKYDAAKTTPTLYSFDKKQKLADPTLFKPGVDLNKLQHCPDFVERHSLLDGVTKAIPYPKKGFNCNRGYAIA